jgi:hypothetical protein
VEDRQESPIDGKGHALDCSTLRREWTYRLPTSIGSFAQLTQGRTPTTQSIDMICTLFGNESDDETNLSYK